MVIRRNIVWLFFWLAAMCILNVFSAYVPIIRGGLEMIFCVFFATVGGFFCITYFWKFNEYGFLNTYVFLFTFCIFISFIYTVNNGYNDLLGTFKYSAYYLAIFLVYPIIYMFYKYDNFKETMETLCFIIILFMVFKAINCITYDATGHLIVEGLTKTARSGHTNAAFNGLDPLVPIFEFNLYLTAVNKKKKLKVFVLFLFSIFYVIWFLSGRMLILTELVAVVMMYLVNKKTPARKLLAYSLITIGIIVFVNTSYFNDMFNTVMTLFDSSYISERDTATIRMMEIATVSSNLKGMLFGIGMSIYGSNHYTSIFPFGSHDDLGLLGTYYLFGVLSIPMIVLLFYRAIKVTYKLKYYSGHELRLGMLIFLIISSISLSLFDAQRVVLLPFILSIYEIENYKYKRSMRT